MRLYYTPTSPFVRKVLVAAHELGLASRIQTEFLRPTPTAPDPVLSRANPLAKIPALVTDDADPTSALYDSPVICAYLDQLAVAEGRAPLVPPAGPEHWRVLRCQALCDGILDAGILVFYERAQRPAALHWDAWLEGQTAKVQQGLDALEREVGTFGAAGDVVGAGDMVDLAQVCAGVTIGWLEFRNAVGEIRTRRPALMAWYDAFRRRDSMRATEPA